MSVQKRRGAHRPSLVPPEIVRDLEAGGESANHMEQIAFDMSALLGNAFPDLTPQAERMRGCGLVAKMRMGGAVLFEAYGERAWSTAQHHRSDSVRGWGAMSIGACPSLALPERLKLIKPFADDPHFAVREWAWLALRPQIALEARSAVDLLEGWTDSPSPRIRRFASEATRPRGVWSAHIGVLKEEPEHGLKLLEPLSSDSSRYVQASVGNWLNDASKSRPEWVRKVCATWTTESLDPATRWICVRGLRTLAKS